MIGQVSLYHNYSGFFPGLACSLMQYKTGYSLYDLVDILRNKSLPE